VFVIVALSAQTICAADGISSVLFGVAKAYGTFLNKMFDTAMKSTYRGRFDNRSNANIAFYMPGDLQSVLRSHGI